MITSRSPCERTIDFRIPRMAGIRLIDARPRDEAVVERQLGPLQGELEGPPDLVIRFVDRLELNGATRWIGAGDSGFTDDAFLIVRGKHQSSIRVAWPLDRLGAGCELICERGVSAVPQLVAAINHIAIARGLVPLHASAFSFQDQGVLVTGWAKGGKTETLLGFMANGATYIGDEWVYLDPQRRTMTGLPEPMRVWDAHLRRLPQYRLKLSGRQRMSFVVSRLLASGLDGLGRFPLVGGLDGARYLSRLAAALNRQRCAQLPPHRLFSGRVSESWSPIDRVVFVVSHDRPEVSVETIDGRELVSRMIFSLQQEYQEFRSAYFKFRFAFPERRSPLIDDAERAQRGALLQLFGEREVTVVYHPFPIDPLVLYSAVCRAIGLS